MNGLPSKTTNAPKQQSPAKISPGGPPRLYLIFILGALSAFAPLSIDMYLPGLPILSRGFDATAAQTQLTLSACLLGLALGQAIAGPISDVFGRRRPLLIGLTAYVLASFLCALSPSIFALIFFRFVQGLAGATGIVIARAIVRDLHSGIAAARFFSLLMIVSGLAPILAPIFGGMALRFTTWHGVFVVLALIGIFLLLATTFGLKETLPPNKRKSGDIHVTIMTFRQLLTDRSFMGYTLSCGLAFSAMFAYISGSPFVLQDIYDLSPQMFSVIFGINALGLVVASQINGRLVGRIPPIRLLAAGLVASVTGGLALLASVVGGVGLVGILPAFFIVVASLGFVLPNATALVMADHPHSAGSASALLGVLQYSAGAIAAPFVGISGEGTALPMAVVIAVLAISAFGVFMLLARSGLHTTHNSLT